MIKKSIFAICIITVASVSSGSLKADDISNVVDDSSESVCKKLEDKAKGGSILTESEQRDYAVCIEENDSDWGMLGMLLGAGITLMLSADELTTVSDK